MASDAALATSAEPAVQSSPPSGGSVSVADVSKENPATLDPPPSSPVSESREVSEEAEETVGSTSVLGSEDVSGEGPSGESLSGDTDTNGMVPPTKAKAGGQSNLKKPPPPPPPPTSTDAKKARQGNLKKPPPPPPTPTDEVERSNTRRKRKGNGQKSASTSKKTKRELEGSESEEEEDSTAVEAAAKAEEADEEEESTRTRDLVSQWSKYHGPTRDFTSKRRWRGDHGGAQYRRQKGKKLKNVKVDPLKLEETPFTDGAFLLRDQPRIDETLIGESLTDYVDRSLKELQLTNENAIMWSVQEFTARLEQDRGSQSDAFEG